MMSIEDYITEAISSGKYRGLSKPSEELITPETNFDDFCIRLEECGVNWKPIKGPDVVPDKEFLECVDNFKDGSENLGKADTWGQMTDIFEPVKRETGLYYCTGHLAGRYDMGTY